MSTPVFKPASAMTFVNAEADRVRLSDFCRRVEGGEIVIDLSEVTQCDSAGLALLIESKRLGRDHNKTCRITGITPAIQSLAEFCRVQDILLT
ncbi:STAS domain-containing protein [Legionella spiritensis]|uniref:Putative anti-sigma-B factor antagonist (Anti-anti-sigma-B factor) n=1 Tax=Legionella spiritensis TaxID=452 RepID=A0A0W0ZAM5_LEGSP|nr:STAS domain-containing protein [Legionella spiritensis]KTD66189.1 putative anti-sigma-B factor antagonist (Anti-anti-sigma-B factor) [Legionella spiritensis]SNV35141.1 putative anti-sigma-B factor antagonist (Anti-anti-sigma-B factor) [Legionella spiritensis]